MDAYSLQRMKLLLCMRDCKANAQNIQQQELHNLRTKRTNLTEQILGRRQIQPFTEANLQNLTNHSANLSRISDRIFDLENENPHLRGRIKSLFLCHLVTAPMLEVDDVETARFALSLRDNYGWSDSYCINGEIPTNNRNLILDELGGIPHQIFQMVLGVPLFAEGN